MSNGSIIQKTKKTFYCALILVSFGLLGCAMVGSVVPVEKRVKLLQTGTIEDTFKSDGLIVKYRYTLTDGSMLLSCSAALNFRVESFDCTSFVSLMHKELCYSKRQYIRQSNGVIEKSLDIPPGTASISFMYSSQPFRGRP